MNEDALQTDNIGNLEIESEFDEPEALSRFQKCRVLWGDLRATM